MHILFSGIHRPGDLEMVLLSTLTRIDVMGTYWDASVPSGVEMLIQAAELSRDIHLLRKRRQLQQEQEL